ncbi:MAG: signal peptidase I [Chloroflexota bacterium]|nr:signal peptidase I [Chloroflexota bacterium]
MVKKAFQVLATILLVVVILACVGIFIAPHFGWHIDIVYGGSMEPAIHLGSLVLIQPVDPRAVKVGDVITYRSSAESGMVTTHRVVEVVNDGSLSFRTKGDANEDPDAYAVPAENVVGSVWLSIPYAGYAMDFIRTPLGFGLLIGIPAALIVGMELKNIVVAVKDLRQKRYDKQVRQASKGHTRQPSRGHIRQASK